MLTVKASRNEEYTEGEKPVIRERVMGSYVRRVRLSDAVDAENIEADLGSIGGTISDAIGVWREFTGREGYGNSEPLLRAAFIDYLIRTEGGNTAATADRPGEPPVASDVER